MRQSNESDCIYICVTTGQTGRAETISCQNIALLILSDDLSQKQASRGIGEYLSLQGEICLTSGKCWRSLLSLITRFPVTRLLTWVSASWGVEGNGNSSENHVQAALAMNTPSS